VAAFYYRVAAKKLQAFRFPATGVDATPGFGTAGGLGGNMYCEGPKKNPA